MIRAECHTDDYMVEADFDATPWFEQADAEAIAGLEECDWGGDYPADAVAEYMAAHDAGVQRLFDYLNIGAQLNIGFECHVNGADAEAWLAARAGPEAAS